MNLKKKEKEQAAPEKNLEPAAAAVKPAKKNIFKSRKFKYGGIATVITILFIVVVIVINMIMGVLDSKVVMEVDLTPNQVYGLTQESIDFVQGLDKDVEINILNSKDSFESGGQYYVQAAAIIENYSKYSSRVTVNYVDLVKNPTFAANYEDENIASNDVLIKCGEKHKLVKSSELFNSEMSYSTFSYVVTSSQAEQSVTSAMVNVTSDEITKVAILTGYDEADYSSLTSMLTSNNFDVQEVNITTDEIPEDAKLAVIFAPGRDYDQSSLKKLDTFLSNNEKLGKSLVFVPNTQPDQIPELNSFLEEWGMSVGSGVMFELSTDHLYNNTTPFWSAAEYVDEDYSSVITNKSIPVSVMQSRPIEILKESESIKVLLESTENSGIYPVDAAEGWQPEESDLTGPITLAAVSTKQVSGVDDVSNVAVVGSAAAFASSLLSSTSVNNSAYFINMFNTLAEREDTVLIEAKTLGGATMSVTTNVSIPLGVVFTIVLPLLILVTGLVIWIRRRNR